MCNTRHWNTEIESDGNIINRDDGAEDILKFRLSDRHTNLSPETSPIFLFRRGGGGEGDGQG